MQNAAAAVDSERTIIATCLVHPSSIPEVAPVVRPEDLFHPSLRFVYEAMLALDGAQRPIDLVTVEATMRSAGTFDRLSASGGADFLAELFSDVVAVGSVTYHARRVKAKARRRAVAQMARELAALGVDEETDDADFFDAVDRKLVEMQRADATGEVSARKVEHIAYEAVRTIEHRFSVRDQPGALGITTGFGGIDSVTTGMQPGELWIVAGRPSMGKSAMAMNMAVGSARARHPTLVFSLEMTSESLVERAMAAESAVSFRAIRTGDLAREELAAITGGAARLARLPIWVDDSGSLTIDGIRARARRWRLREGASAIPAVVVVDYLQLVNGQTRKGNVINREREVADVSRGLKALAKELGACVVALAQLNRGCEDRPDKRPMLSDLRESGQIEQDADLVAFMFRDEYYHHGCPPSDLCGRCDQNAGRAEFVIAKQRNGQQVTVPLRWDGRTQRFSDDEGGR